MSVESISPFLSISHSLIISMSSYRYKNSSPEEKPTVSSRIWTRFSDNVGQSTPLRVFMYAVCMYVYIYLTFYTYTLSFYLSLILIHLRLYINFYTEMEFASIIFFFSSFKISPLTFRSLGALILKYQMMLSCFLAFSFTFTFTSPFLWQIPFHSRSVFVTHIQVYQYSMIFNNKGFSFKNQSDHCNNQMQPAGYVLLIEMKKIQ